VRLFDELAALLVSVSLHAILKSKFLCEILEIVLDTDPSRIADNYIPSQSVLPGILKVVKESFIKYSSP